MLNVVAPRPLRTNFNAPAAMDKEAVKRNGFHDQGILVLNLDDPRLTWPEKILLRQIGERLYGQPRVITGHG